MKVHERAPLYAQQQRKIEQIREGGHELSAIGRKIIAICEETLTNGGVINVQAMINNLTGTYARLLKDYGIVENLQNNGASLRSTLANQRRYGSDRYDNGDRR